MLLLFQCALILRGETTWEHLRRERINAAEQLPPDARPYDLGPLVNLITFYGCNAGCRLTKPVAVRPVSFSRPALSPASAPTVCPPVAASAPMAR